MSTSAKPQPGSSETVMRKGQSLGIFELASLAWRALLRDPKSFLGTLRRYLRPMPAPYRRRYRMRLRQWLQYHQREIVFEQCTWMGVRTLKNPLDAWIYQEILHEVRPEVVVELGSAEGGSALYFAHLLDLMKDGQVVTVDRDRSKYAVEHERIVPITGDIHDPSVIERVSEMCRGKRVLVVHDADHRSTAVLRDLRAYAPLVSEGSYVIVEDGIVDLYRPGDGLGFAEDGPLVAAESFVAENPEFVIDVSRERYLLTYNPRGYLKRVAR